MKHIREAVHDIIEQQILPMVERDGISNLLLPEQITAEHCVKIPKRERPYIGHREHELGIGLAGEAVYWIADQAFIFTPDRMVLLPSRTIHTSALKGWYRAGNLDLIAGSSVLWMTFCPFGIRMQVSRDVIKENLVESTQPYILLDRDFNMLITRLLEELHSRRPHYAGVGWCILMEILHRCLRATVTDAAEMDAMYVAGTRSYANLLKPHRRVGGKTKKQKRTRSKPKTRSKKVPQIVRDAEDFIHFNYHMPLGLDEIADAAGTNPDHLGRQFKAATGMTPIQYLVDTRMKAARELLLTDLRVLEIGRMVGIEDPCHFSRLFRRTTGLSPIKFRRKMAKLSRLSPPPKET